MPTYEYSCDDCGKGFELFQRITDDPVDKCPACGGRARRLVSNGNFILKGNGWYKTDYSAQAGPAGSGGEKGEPACGQDPSGPGCETCPAGARK